MCIRDRYLPAITAAAIKTGIAISPFLILGARILIAAAAFSLIYDDINNFLKGEDSLIGAIAEKWPKAGKIIESFAGNIQFLITYIKELTKWLTGGFLEGVNKAFSSFKNLINLRNENKESLEEPIEDEQQERRLNIIEQRHQEGSDLPPIIDTLEQGQQAIDKAEQNPLTTSTPNEIVSHSKQIQSNNAVNINKINIDAQGSDSGEISNNIGSALGDEMQKLISNYDDGIAN